MRQVGVSRTLVFDDPRRALVFFESLVTDNVDIGRPDQVSMVFARPLRRPTNRPYRERLFTAAPRGTWTSLTSTAGSSNT